jgi:aryl-alcohol dehydrogenase-like predicted oxidoreductase
VIPGHQDVYFHEQAWERLDRLEEVAQAHEYSQAHLALAWVFHQPNIDCVLIGSRKIGHLNQAVGARDEDGEVLREL